MGTDLKGWIHHSDRSAGLQDRPSLDVSWVGWVGLWGFGLVGMGLIVACGCGGVPRVVAVGGLCLPAGSFLGVVGGRWFAGAMGRRVRAGC